MGRKKSKGGHYTPQDRYFQAAKRAGYRSRAAFKLIEIIEKYSIFRPGMTVLDLGAAPGGWSQVVLEQVGPKGKVIGVDLQANPLPPQSNYRFITGDLTDPAIKARLQEALDDQKVDLVLSDMAPPLSGIKARDQQAAQELAEIAWSLANHFLRSGGHLVLKAFPGEHLSPFKRQLKERFAQVHEKIPAASRSTSKETYLVARKYGGEGRKKARL